MAVAGLYWIQFVTADVRQVFGADNTEYVELFALGVSYQNAFTTAGFLGLLQCFKVCCLCLKTATDVCVLLVCWCTQVFKYFSISKKMNALWFTLANAAPDLLAFLAGWVLCLAVSRKVKEHVHESSFKVLLLVPAGLADKKVSRVCGTTLPSVGLPHRIEIVSSR